MHEQEKALGTKTKKAMRTLKDREKVLYAPFSNVGALNFDKSTGYITIPDSQVIYTRVTGDDEDEDAQGMGKATVQEVDARGDIIKKIKEDRADPTGNEGQKMMWHLQDLQE